MRAREAADLVERISWTHTSLGIPATLRHTEPAVGCRWCVPQPRANEARLLVESVLELVTYCHCGCDTPSPPDRDARTLLAALDLMEQEQE
jgi:hypothetical protein